MSARAASKPAAARDFAIEVGRLLANTRCVNVVVLDAEGISPVTDFMVLATGTSPRQMKSAADEIDEYGAAMASSPVARRR